jgi:hypothetical protein
MTVIVMPRPAMTSSGALAGTTMAMSRSPAASAVLAAASSVIELS